MRKLVIAGGFLALLSASAWAYLFQPTSVPDALTRANAWIKDHPDRAEGYFFLGRINGSAWAKGTVGDAARVSIASFGDPKNPPFFVPWESLMVERDPKLEITTESRQFLEASLAAYRKAVEIDGTRAVYELGLAWSLEQAAKIPLRPAADMAAQAKLTPEEQKQCEEDVRRLGDMEFAVRAKADKSLAALMPRDADLLLGVKSDDAEIASRIQSILANYWLRQAAEHYSKAYALSIDADLKSGQYDAEADATVSVRAGERLLAMQPSQSAASPEALKAIEGALKIIKARPVFSHTR